jgi:steroid 5-alpha reductase family enzyme
VSAWALLALGAGLAGALMGGLWLVQLRSRDATPVDVGWAYGIGLLGTLDAFLGGGAVSQRLLEGVLVALWSLRLGSYVLVRGVLGRKGEDRRYAEMRRRYGVRADRRFLVFFEAQAALVVVFSIPLLLASFDRSSRIGALEWVGVALWAVGVVGESLADRQLAAFRAEPANRGRTARVGLWRYSRHPNYFFEWLVWVGLALVGLPAPFGALGLLVPALLLVLVLFVTGIPPSEKQALRSRGEDYRLYQHQTSVFVPWFPRR